MMRAHRGPIKECGTPQFRSGAVSGYGHPVATFVIETYLSRARAEELDGIADRLRTVIRRRDQPSLERPPRYLRSYYVAEDEIAYHLVESGSTEAAAELSRAAGIEPERILAAEAAP